MAQYSKPFVQVEFDVLFDGGAEESAAPAAAFAMCDGSTDRSAGTEEEEVDVGIYLKIKNSQ